MKQRKPIGLGVIERATGRITGPVIPFRKGDFICKMPNLDLRVWHYMEYWKFEALIRDRSLYFRRSDKLDDDMEGKYAEANRRHTTAMYQRFLQAYPVKHDPQKMEEGNEGFRFNVFINCWHLNRIENPTMWKRFTKSENSVVLRSTVRKLVQAMSNKKATLARVIYASQTIPRPEWSHDGPFFFKDTRFIDEREFRLIAYGPDGVPIDIEKDLGQKISVEPDQVIEQVILHPSATAEFKGTVKTLLENEKVQISVSKSALTTI